MSDREDQIYELMNQEDSSGIEELLGTAWEEGDMEQYQIDFEKAKTRYQAAHEMPEEEREQNTVEFVKETNQEAAEEEE